MKWKPQWRSSVNAAVLPKYGIRMTLESKNMTRSRSKTFALAVAASCVVAALIAMAYTMIGEPNAGARSTIASILLSPSTPQQKLADLTPYVQAGDQISEVHQRVALHPDSEMQIERPTQHSYGLGGDVQLVLAIRANGTVTGIGRHKNGEDHGTVWLSPPDWSSQ